AVRQWGHVRMFSPWEYNIDAAAGRLLAASGWNSPDPARYPTGAELLEQYLEPLGSRTALRTRIHADARVTAISRHGIDKLKDAGRAQAPFVIQYRNGAGAKTLRADAVIDASGAWFAPNPAGANGLPAAGEEELSGRIVYGMPDIRGRDRARYAGKIVGVLGAGHSAVGNLIDLARLRDQVPETQPIWLLRGDKPEKAFGGGVNDKLAARGELGALFAGYVKAGSIDVQSGFRVTHITPQGDRLRVGAGGACCGRQVLLDELIVAAGFRPHVSLLRELRIALDPAVEAPPALAPLIDPNGHSCGTVRPHGARELAHPEPGFYIAGMKSYGRAPTFLMRTGYEQVRSILADIDGDRAAAEHVELVLPETGVCSLSPGGEGCETPAKSDANACCAADLAAKQQGASGCGCA